MFLKALYLAVVGESVQIYVHYKSKTELDIFTHVSQAKISLRNLQLSTRKR